jgi:VWFA-related protein
MCRYGTLAAVVLSSVVLFSQEPATSSQPSAPLTSIRSLLISARAKDGVVGELTASDLEIAEDGKPVRIRQVRKLDQAPMRYCVLFDTSNSERDQFKLQQMTAIRLLQQVVRPGTDRGWVSLFDAASNDGKETGSPNDVAISIAASRPGGGTALFDATAQCAKRMAEDPSELSVRRMFLFSDGDDNQSHITHGRAIETAIFAGLRIYAIGPEDPHHTHGSNILKKFAQNSGGEFFTCDRPTDIEKIAPKLNGDLRNLFNVNYEEAEAKPDNGPRRIEVKCLKKGVTVLAPKWIYPPRP